MGGCCSFSDKTEVEHERATRILGDYELFEEIGSGGMGVVYRAKQVSANRYVAVKMISPNRLLTSSARERFELEAQVVAGFNHPNIVMIYEVRVWGDEPFFSMAYVKGTNLAEIVRDGPMSCRRAAQLTKTIAEATQYAHERGILHFDLKSSNVLVDDTGRPWITDFGLARRVRAESPPNATDHGGGSPGFWAPEQAEPLRHKDIGVQTDVHGLGAILFHLVTGRPPFQPRNLTEAVAQTLLADPQKPSELNPGADRHLEAICLKCLEKEPRRRYANAQALADDLGRYLSGKPTTANPVGPFERLRMWMWRHPVHAALGATVCLLLLTAVGAVYVNRAIRAKAAEVGRFKLERQLLLTRAQSTRLTPHSVGWSADAWRNIAQAARIPAGIDTNAVREQAAAVLAGLDAEPTNLLTNLWTRHLAFDSSGSQIAMDDEQGGPVRRWDLKTGALQGVGNTNTGPLWFTERGELLQFACVGPGHLIVSSLDHNERLREFRISEAEVLEVPDRPILAVSDDRTLCAVSVFSKKNGSHGQVAAWDIASGKLLIQASEVATALTFSPDSRCLATGDAEGRVRIRTLHDLKDVIVPFQEDRVQISSLAFRRDLTQPIGAESSWLLAAGDAGGTIRIYGTTPRSIRAICRGSHYDVYALAFSPDNMTLASCGRGNPRLWDVATGKGLLRIPEGTGGEYWRAVAFSRDGTRLALGREHGSCPGLSVLRLNASRGVNALRGLSSQIGRVAFSPDGNKLAAISHDWHVAVWSLASNRLDHLFSAPKGILADNASLAFKRDGRHLAFATSERAVLWDLANGEPAISWTLPRGLGQRVCFDPNGRVLLFQWDSEAGTRRGSCRMRELLPDGKASQLWKSEPFDGRLLDVALASDGQFLAVCGRMADANSYNHVLKIFEAFTGRELPSPPAYGKGDDESLVFDPTGRLLMTYAARPLERLLYQLPRVEGFPCAPLTAALGPEGRWLVTEVLEDPKGFVLRRSERPSWSLALGMGYTCNAFPQFSADGKLLAFGTAEGIVLVHDIAEMCRRVESIGLGWK